MLIYIPSHNTDIPNNGLKQKQITLYIIVYLAKVVDFTKSQISWLQK